jgi:uncharacterized membrane protein SpoIIM required for sporulation
MNGADANEDAIARAALRSDRFRLAREAEWQRLDDILTALEKGRMARIADEDLLALPALYRTAASSLSVARETSLDAAALRYLESLVQRAWFQIYGPRQGFVRWLRGYLGGGWSAAVRGIGKDVLIALAVMVLGTAAGWLLCAGNPDWFYTLVPSGLAGERGPESSVEILRQTLGSQDDAGGLSAFAAYLFSNNSGVAILAFALGFAFGVPTILLLIYNMASLGAMLWLFFRAGLGLDFVAWLSVHGTTEFFAILLAGAAGLHVGRAMAFPGDNALLAATAQAGRRAALVMVGVVLMLVVAALLEGYARQLVGDTPSRLAIGGSVLALWLAYFYALRPRGGEGRA